MELQSDASHLIKDIKPTATVRHVLAYLNTTSGWEGDDLDACLEIVKNSRSKAQLRSGFL